MRGVRWGQTERAPRQEDRADVGDGGVKLNGQRPEGSAAGPQVEGGDLGLEHWTETSVRDADAFWVSGGARAEEDVGEVVGLGLG